MKTIFSYSKIFTVLLSVLYIFGLIASFYNLEIILSILVFIFLVFIVLFRNFDFKKVIILYLIFFAGISRANNSYKIDNVLKDIKADNVIIKGQIVSSKDVSNKNNRVKFYLRADDVTIKNEKTDTNYNNINSKVLVSLDMADYIEDKIIIGDYIELQGKLRQPKEATNPHQFDYKQYLLNNDCTNVFYGNYTTFKVTGEPNFSVKNPRDCWYYALKKFELIRIKILEKHSKNIPPDRLKILGGLVFGDETISPDEKIKEDFKNSGLLHLLAASGLNVALIYGIWWRIASLIRFPYHLSILAGALFVIFYTFMTGFPPSIIRAGIIILFILLGKLIDRKADSVALIFFAAFLILLCSPKMFFDIGFQLSFVVTFGLVICCPIIISKFSKIEERFKNKHKNKRAFVKYILYLFSPVNLISILVVPLVAQLWVIPLQLHYFNNFAPMSIFANIAVIPFIGALSFIGFISSIIALVPYISDFMVFLFDFIASPLLLLLIKISEFFASFKFSIISTSGFNFVQIFTVWGIILIFVLNLKNNFQNKKHKILLVLSFILLALSFIKSDIFSKNPEIIMFDVENADCFLIKTPKHKYIMIDTGKKIFKGVSLAQIVINRYLRNERINKLEYLIITHFDIDHAGGAIDILNDAKVKNILIQKEEAKSFTSKEILEYLSENNFNYRIAKNNEVIYSEPDFKITSFKPEIKTKANKDKEDNETSIIILLTYKDKNVLFMADSGIEGFDAIKDGLPENIDIIKIGHHGAKGVIDKNMLRRIKPEYALISSGENKFNHPHYETLNLLYENNTRIFPTRDYGFVRIVLNKDKIFFKHFNKYKHKQEDIILPDYEKIFTEEKYIKKFVEENLKKN